MPPSVKRLVAVNTWHFSRMRREWPAPRSGHSPSKGRRRSWMSASSTAAVAACATYAVSSVMLSLTNKALFSRHHFDFPLSVLASQALGTCLLLRLGGALGLSSAVPLDAALLRRMSPITLLFVLMLWTSSRALRYCSVPVVTIFKNVAVAITTAYEYAVYNEPISVGIVLSLVCMLAGSIVAGIGDLQFSLRGYSWLLLNVACTVGHIAAIRAWLGGSKATAASKTLHNQLLALSLFAAGAAAQGELKRFPTRLAAQPATFQLGFAGSIVLGLLINCSSFWCLAVTSGTTYSFVGASNKIPAAILGHYLFDSGLNALGWAGIAGGLSAGLLYANSKHRLAKAQRELEAGGGGGRELERWPLRPAGLSTAGERCGGAPSVVIDKYPR